jgi:hypothetical protein
LAEHHVSGSVFRVYGNTAGKEGTTGAGTGMGHGGSMSDTGSRTSSEKPPMSNEKK